MAAKFDESPDSSAGLEKPINGRSTFVRLNSTGKVYTATLAMYAKQNADGTDPLRGLRDRPPTVQEWQKLLNNGGFAGPRDKTPTPPGAAGNLVYGRVAGVQRGSLWRAVLVDRGEAKLKIPEKRQSRFRCNSLRAFVIPRRSNCGTDGKVEASSGRRAIGKN
ncbi:MAG: DUF3370 family protein [Microcoleus sp.]